MPYMSIRTSSEISKENMEDLKSQFGKAISLLPGKSESFLMISFEDNCKLYFRGNNQEDIAFVEVKLFGKADKASCDKLTAKISDILEDKLRIKPSQVYIRYQDTEIWGCNGSNF
jgi:phenylpyruvate tautomerase PptA (4-oxalocrotonate tautomerase family)